jgi:flagellar biosynthetic protein FliR
MPSLPFATLDQFIVFMLVLGRVAGILAATPMFGGKLVPTRVKAALAFALTLVLFPILLPKLPPLPSDALSFGIVMVKEALIGISLGLLSQIIFAAVEFCGFIVSSQMGLSIALQFDPTLGMQVSALTVFQNLLAMLLFLTLGAHHLFFSAIVESYQLLPVGTWHMSGELLKFFTTTVSGIFVLGIKLAAPVMASLLAVTVILGIMARVFPQMNVFMVSMPLNIGLGFLFLGASLMAFIQTIERAFGTIPVQIRALFKLLA